MRRTVLTLVLVALGATVTSAQIVVFDPAVTFRHRITATLKEYVLNAQREQHRTLRRMARRLSMHTNLDKYTVPDPPRWRTRRPEDDVLFTHKYNLALIVGDSSGSAYLGISEPVLAAREAVNRLPPAARQAFTARLATVNVADAAAIAATNDTGRLRDNGRTFELHAINALEGHVIDPSNEQSATAVLDKISGAVLIGARQRQARMQLLAGVVEHLLVESKRERDTEAAAMDMQIVTWRDARAANTAFVAGAGDALRTWRQPN
jgi:hypothetical protein